MSKLEKQQIFPFISFSILLIGVAYVLSKIDPNRVVEIFLRLDIRLYLLTFTIFLLNLLMSGLKWRRVLLQTGINVPFQKAMHYYSYGFMYNFFLPSLLSGDIVKSYAFGKKNAHPFSKIFFTTFVDRLSGFIALITIGTISFVAFLPRKEVPILILAIFLLILVALASYLSQQQTVRKLLDVLAKKSEFAKRIRKAYNETKIFEPKFIFFLGIAAFAYQISGMFAHFILFRALGIDISILQVFLMLSVVRIAEGLPISFGGIGLRESILVLFSGLIGTVGPNRMVAYSLTAYTLPLIFSLSFGIYHLFKGDLLIIKKK